MKLTPILERLILQGKARFATWSFGTAGAGTLRLSKNEFMILLDFDYFHFVDEPLPQEAEPAITIFSIRAEDPAAPFNIQGLNISGVPLVSPDVAFDPADVPTSQLNLQAWLDSFFLGFTCTVQFAGGAWKVTVTTTPGTTYNGQIIDGGISIPGPGITPGTFAGGADAAATTAAQLLERATHQLEFRQKGARYSWIIAENVQVMPNAGGPLTVNVTGMYQKDLFIPFTQSVQIGIVQVPPVDDWGVTYGPLDAKSNEPKLPGGYGTVDSGANLDVVYEVLFDTIVNEQYLPVTEERSDATLLQYREQFKVDYRDGRQLNNPQGTFTNQGAARRYPIINMSYVVVNMRWEDFQKYLSNGQDCKDI